MTLRTGRLLMTGGVADAVAERGELAAFVRECLGRHASGDWGDVDDEDRQTNDWAVGHEERVISSYRLPRPLRVPTNFSERSGEDRLWVITERDRSATTLLWPSEY